MEIIKFKYEYYDLMQGATLSFEKDKLKKSFSLNTVYLNLNNRYIHIDIYSNVILFIIYIYTY